MTRPCSAHHAPGLELEQAGLGRCRALLAGHNMVSQLQRGCMASAQEHLGVLLEKEDEMDCLVGGANFLLKAIHHEAFMYENSQTLFTPSNCAPCCLLLATRPRQLSHPAIALVAVSAT